MIAHAKGQEDCLYLNVHTKDLNRKAPVIVNIHGGGFQLGSGDPKWSQNPDLLMNGDVVNIHCIGNTQFF